MASALVMAGGRSSRMRAGTAAAHKAIVPILGVPLLERNLNALIAAGFDDIVVSISSEEPAVSNFVKTRGAALARASGASIDVFIEKQALGTIGAARAAIGNSDSVLVVNVDNLTAINLRDFTENHAQSGAAMSVACHHEPFVMPFGEVRCSGEIIEEYIEKPVHRFLISSGTYVLSPRACLAIEENVRTGAPELIARLVAHGEAVRAFRHDAPWIDVNDPAAVVQAESLVADNADRFERLYENVDGFCANLVLRSPKGVLVERDSETKSWNVPAQHLTSGDTAEAHNAAIAMLRERAPSSSPASALSSFDEYDIELRTRVRHFTFLAETPGSDFRGGVASRWIAGVNENDLADVGSRSRRCLAWAARTR